MLEDYFTDKNKTDPDAKPDFESAQAKIEEMGNDAETGFMPADTVNRLKKYEYTISQTYACLLASEFLELVGVNPDHPSLKCKSISVPWNGPGEKKNGLTNFYLLHLSGLDVHQAMACRKCTLTYAEGVLYSEIFLQPSDQLIASQGSRVFQYVTEKSDELRPEMLRVSSSKQPMSFEDCRKKVERFQEEEGRAEQSIAAEALRLQKHGSDDEFDDLLQDDEEREALNNIHKLREAKKRSCGLDGGSLAHSATPKKVKATAAKKRAGPDSAKAKPAEPSDAGSTAAPTSKASELKSVSGRSDGGSSTLDPEMAIVASKHAGGSTKCLENFTVEYFLDETVARTSLASKLRGATGLLSVVWS